MQLIISLFMLSHPALAGEPPAAVPPTDSQMAAIVHSANEADIDNGKMAKSRAQKQEVKDFALDMIKDHETSNDELKKVLKHTKLKKDKTQSSQGLENDAEQTAKRLKSLKGAAFDQAYVDSEVQMHKAVLANLEKELIPNATNSEFKEYLIKTQSVISEHLGHAQHLQASLKGEK